MTFQPTKEELIELGFYNMNVFLWWKKIWNIGSLYYNESTNSWFLQEHEWMPSIRIPFCNIGELFIFLNYCKKEKHNFPKPRFDYLELYEKLTK